MSLDEQLLAQQQEPDERNAETAWSAYDSARESAWADKASRLREAQRAGDRPDGQGAKSLREAVLAEKRKDAAKAVKDESGIGVSASPISLGTSRLLQQSWLSLIPSWGLTLIWVNIHVFLSYVLGEKLFCKLGEEWASMIPGGAAGAIGSAAGAKPPVKSSNECCMLVGCDLGCLFVIIAAVSVLALVAKLFTDLPGTMLTFFQSIWESLFGK